MKNFIILSGIIFLDAIALFIMVPVMPNLLAELTNGNIELNSIWSSLLMLSYAAMQFIFAPLIGSLSDRYGRKNIFIFSAINFSLNFFIMAISNNIWWLFVGRLLSGISGASMSTVIASASDISSSDNRSKNFSNIYGMFGIGMVLGPILGGYLAYFGTRVPFWTSAIVWLINLFIIIFFFTETLDYTKRKKTKTKYPLKSIYHVLKHPGFLKLIFANFIFSIGMQSIIIISAFYTKLKFNWDAKQIGLSMTFLGVSYAFSQLILPRLIFNKFSKIKLLLLGLVFNTTGYLMIGLATSGPFYYLGILTFALGSATIGSRIELFASNVNDDEQGLLQGVLTSINSIAKIIGPIVISSVFYYSIKYSLPLQGGLVFIFSALLTIIAMIFYLLGYIKLEIK